MKPKVCSVCGVFVLLFLLLMFGGFGLKENEVKLVFCYNGQTFEWTEPQTNIFIFQDELSKRCYGKNGTERAKLIEKIVKMGFSTEQAFCYVFSGLDKTLKNLENAVKKEKKDAKLNFNPQNFPYFEFEKEQIGLFVDKEALLKQVLSKLKQTNFVQIVVNANKMMPKVTVQDLMKQTFLRSSFETDFSSSSQNRKDNISLALKNFNGMVLKPNKTYSFNQTTGRRTEAKGYKQANIILNNEYVESFGGGVCQASTTLFNALILAGAEIMESHPHSLESGYIEKGFDAMVNFGSSDLKWKNTTKSPMYVRAFTTDQKVCVQIFGEQNLFQTRRVCEVLETKILEDVVVEDNSLPLGKVFYKTYPKKGSTSKSFLEYYKNGTFVAKKLLRKQTYNPVQGVKIVGTKPVVQTPVPIPQNLNFPNQSQNQTGFTTWKTFSN